MIKHILGLLAKTFGIAAGIGAAVSLAGRLFGWVKAVQFANGLYIAGITLIGIGLLTIAGGYAQRGDFSIRYADGVESLHDISMTIPANAISVLVGVF